MDMKIEKLEKIKLKPSAFLIQVIATICICFLACQTGFVCAWPSFTIENFKSNDTVLSTPMTTFEVSLLGSLGNIGAFAATPFCGYAFNNFGRKYATILFGLPYVLNWAIIYLTRSVLWILLAVTISGIGVAGQNASLIFISEISHDSIRGGMTALSASGYFLGLMVGYALGGYLTYYQVIYANMTMAVIAMVLLMVLPESPVFLVLVGKIEAATKSISFYNRLDPSSKEVETEIKRIQIQLDPRLEKVLEAELDPEALSRLLADKEEDKVKPHTESAWKILKQSKSSKRALAVVLVMMASSVLMGSPVMQVYAEPLFKEAVPSMSSNQCSIFLALDFLVSSFVCVMVIDKFGRKNLMIATSVGSGVCNLLLGTQLHFHWAGYWFTAFLIYAFNCVFTLGCGVIPFVLNAEVFLPEVRSLCSSIIMSSLWVILFFLLFIFNHLVELIGLGPVFYCFSSICFFSAIFSYVALPETKGLSADAIQALFLKKKI
ncbi:facilitated trehalose transporter Tret1 [Amyelois transitella]|uniref:facilitated trehalose transporter Tret1 n=1 Tax=Amyelois transitella TaxID=680683 RepID=UPI00298F9DEA|nr:facilitated trehalose transporter Tret1 [Amyelois transitella]